MKRNVKTPSQTFVMQHILEKKKKKKKESKEQRKRRKYGTFEDQRC